MAIHRNRNLPEVLRSGTWNPIREISRMQRGMDRMFEDFLAPVSDIFSPDLLSTAGEAISFMPACDIEETDEHFLVSFDLPGVSKDDVKIEMRGNQLLVSGERKEEHERKAGRRVTEERYYGAFQRVFTLPSHVDANKIEAQYQNGVLRISLPKLEAAKPKLIQIKEGKEVKEIKAA